MTLSSRINSTRECDAWYSNGKVALKCWLPNGHFQPHRHFDKIKASKSATTSWPNEKWDTL